jgi:enoyl-CoA hydratase/carnithine racemase
VRVRVIIADDLPALDTAAAKPSLGRIHFRDGDPMSDIERSLAAARRLSASARLGDRRVGSLPGAIGAGLLPRVLGRGLAHEIGHLVLHSREHAAMGLMASGFTPEEAAWGSASRFMLSKTSALAVRSECTARRMAAR